MTGRAARERGDELSRRVDQAAPRIPAAAAVELGGEGNEGVLRSAARNGGFERDPASAISDDLAHLVKHGCLSETWMGPIRVVRLTDRGEDAAYGRIDVEGVEKARWKPG